MSTPLRDRARLRFPSPFPIVLSLACVLSSVEAGSRTRAQEPEAINPFGTPAEQAKRARPDAIPGSLELSDGSVFGGRIFLTRELRLKIYDEQRKLHREIPLRAIRRIDGIVQKEWLEAEWRFKENASDEKVYTGRSYPAREYAYKVILQNGQSIQGTISAIVFVQAEGADEPGRFLLHKRDKGEAGTELKSLVYVRSIRLGEKARQEAETKGSKRQPISRPDRSP